jgi:putative tryptophan/tyrosine transport system substrate-binding protein
MICRREFITLLGGAAATWPLAARAALASEASGQRGDFKLRAPDTRPEPGSSARAEQTASKLPTIGFLGVGSPSSQLSWFTAFAQRLRELGWIDGRSVAITLRWAEGRNGRFPEIAAEFVALKVSVIVTGGGAVPAVKQATSTIPIVFSLANDPVGSGYVASLARPGGNVTGLSGQSTDLIGKRVELLREIMPALRRLAIIGDSSNRSVRLEVDEVQRTARTLGIEITAFEIGRAEDIAPTFEKLKGKTEALYLTTTPLLTTNRNQLNMLALGARLPTMYGNRDTLEVGGLMSYGPDIPALWRRSADYVDKILRGAKPADIPVEQPTKFSLVVNLTTAKMLGLEMPPTLLARADEVIE